MVQLTKAKVRQFEEVAKANANDCVVLTSGRLADQPPEGQARIIASTSKATAEALRDAMVKVLNDADAHRSEPSLPDKNRFNVLYEQLDAKLKSGHGTSAYYFSDESSKAPADIKCKAGILVFSEALTLPEKDRRFMLTTFFSPE